jgi:sec-independent protein translocase protein TatA
MVARWRQIGDLTFTDVYPLLNQDKRMGIFDWKHWIVLIVVVVLVFGTKKLKNLGSDLGESIKGFRHAMSEDESPKSAPAPATPQVQLNELHTTDAEAAHIKDRPLIP